MSAGARILKPQPETPHPSPKPSLGPLIQEVKADGGTLTLLFANFLVYISHLHSQGGSFTKLVQSKHAQNRWGLILYTDDIIPGNVLGRAERKAWTIYATFDEFKPRLHHTDFWLTLGQKQSHPEAILNQNSAPYTLNLFEELPKAPGTPTMPVLEIFGSRFEVYCLGVQRYLECHRAYSKWFRGLELRL